MSSGQIILFVVVPSLGALLGIFYAIFSAKRWWGRLLSLLPAFLIASFFMLFASDLGLLALGCEGHPLNQIRCPDMSSWRIQAASFLVGFGFWAGMAAVPIGYLCFICVFGIWLSKANQ